MGDNDKTLVSPSEQETTESGPPGRKSGDSIFGNLDDLRQRQDFDALVKATRTITSVSVGKPGRQMWIRVHPSEKCQLVGAILTVDEEKVDYFVHPNLYPELESEVKRVQLRLVVTKQGTPIIWALRLPNPDGSDNRWFESARAAAQLAESEWIRVRANLEAGAYDVYRAQMNFGPPQWPSQPFNELLEIAFRDRVITSLDHPVVQRLHGSLE